MSTVLFGSGGSTRQFRILLYLCLCRQVSRLGALMFLVTMLRLSARVTATMAVATVLLLVLTSTLLMKVPLTPSALTGSCPSRESDEQLALKLLTVTEMFSVPSLLSAETECLVPVTITSLASLSMICCGVSLALLSSLCSRAVSLLCSSRSTEMPMVMSMPLILVCV